MAEIIGKYLVTVFDNGKLTVDTVWQMEQSEERNDLDLSNCGGRISQVLSVINYAYYGSGTIEQRVQHALSRTAAQYSISISSVFDKITRQLSLNISEFRAELDKLFSNNCNDTLKDIIMNKLGVSTHDHDKLAVEELFNKIYQDRK